MKNVEAEKEKPKHLSATTQFAAASVLFVVATIASRGAVMSDWEINVFQFVYGLPDFLFPLFIVVTQLGSVYMLGLLLVLYLVRGHYHIVLRLFMTGVLSYLAAGFAKSLWGRERPYQMLANVFNLDFAAHGPGYPSGHMALATALAFTMAHYVKKKYRWLLWTALAGVGLSRMYLGVHAPLDIVGGYAIGWAAYALFRHVRLYDITFKQRSQARE